MNERIVVRVQFAPLQITTRVLEFQKKNIQPDNNEIYNGEFLCENGLKSAIRKKNVVVAYSGENIVGMLRFYPKLNKSEISLYQFAVDNDFRGQGVFNEMISFLIKQYDFELTSKCFKESSFNEYYKNKGWELSESSGNLNIWVRHIREDNCLFKKD